MISARPMYSVSVHFSLGRSMTKDLTQVLLMRRRQEDVVTRNRQDSRGYWESVSAKAR
jgi:hypothetical protein